MSAIHVKGSLSVFTLVMINVIAVDNLRSVTIGAEFGFALLFFYGIAALLFFIPTVLVTAELATGWPVTGGAYVWIKEAFGPQWGFFSIWLQWIYNVVWYPTIFAFIAGVLAYLFDPAVVDNKGYMLTVILLTFWAMTLINFFGLKISSIVSIMGALVGTILPMLFIAFLGGWWLFSGRPSHIHFDWQHFLPNHNHTLNIAFITNILFGLMGIEMSAIHAGEVHQPQRDYPRALAYSSAIILATLVLASLAIAVVLPVEQLNLVSGLIEAFKIFFSAYGLKWCVPIIALLIVVGSLSGAAAWIIGPAKGLWVASQDNGLPAFLGKLNTKKVPVNILLVQGLIVTVLCLLFLLMPSVKSSYWLLSNLTAQLALIFYILFFAAAIRLHYKSAHIKRSFKIPGGAWGVWIVSGMGMLTCLTAILLGFLPPTQIGIGQVWRYELLLISGMIIFCLPPFIFQLNYRK